MFWILLGEYCEGTSNGSVYRFTTVRNFCFIQFEPWSMSPMRSLRRWRGLSLQLAIRYSVYIDVQLPRGSNSCVACVRSCYIGRSGTKGFITLSDTFSISDQSSFVTFIYWTYRSLKTNTFRKIIHEFYVCEMDSWIFYFVFINFMNFPVRKYADQFLVCS